MFFSTSVGCESGVVSQHIRLNGTNIREQHCTLKNDEGLGVVYLLFPHLLFNVNTASCTVGILSEFSKEFPFLSVQSIILYERHVNLWFHKVIFFMFPQNCTLINNHHANIQGTYGHQLLSKLVFFCQVHEQ